MQTQGHIRGYWSTVSMELGKIPESIVSLKPFLGKEKSSSLNKNVNTVAEGNRIETTERKETEGNKIESFRSDDYNYFSIFRPRRMVLQLATKSQMNANLVHMQV